MVVIGSFSHLKKEKKTQSQPNNFESNNIMVKQKFVIDVLKHAESKAGLYLGYLCLCRRFFVILCPRSWLFSSVFISLLKHDKCLVETSQSGFSEYTNLLLSIGYAFNFTLFLKKQLEKE